MRGPVLTTHDLSKTYGTRSAVKHLNLEVVGGEILGFLGPNGAGKTTTIRMALGLIRPTSGWVEVLGRDVAHHGAEVAFLPVGAVALEGGSMIGKKILEERHGRDVCACEDGGPAEAPFV